MGADNRQLCCVWKAAGLIRPRRVDPAAGCYVAEELAYGRARVDDPAIVAQPESMHAFGQISHISCLSRSCPTKRR